MFEFALIMPLLLAMLVGIFEAARAVWIVAAVNTASREASRYGSSSGDNGSGTPRFIDCAGIRAVAQEFGWPGAVSTGDVTITYDAGPGTLPIGSCPVSVSDLSTCDRVVVQVVGHFDPAAFIPLVNFPEFDITSTNRRTLIAEFLVESPDPC
jgi:Flp pilus assembly protein TadG